MEYADGMRSIPKLETMDPLNVTWKRRNHNFNIRGKGLKERGYTMSTFIENSGLGTIERVSFGGIRSLSALVGLNTELCNMLIKAVLRADRRKDVVAAVDSCTAILREGLRLMTTEDDHFGWAHPATWTG